ncbi:MAG: winged helix-turn-helix transcriptional regulator [Pirellulales bacterium]|nr:winged helix-turn-helix transcriptional regulator [Pirellulales bacterium]
MLKPGIVREVEILLADGGYSQRAIAARLGISRGTVLAIALRKRTERLHNPAVRRAEHLALQPTAPPVRCRGCGGMVYLPCVVCAVRGGVSTLP